MTERLLLCFAALLTSWLGQAHAQQGPGGGSSGGGISNADGCCSCSPKDIDAGDVFAIRTSVEIVWRFGHGGHTKPKGRTYENKDDMVQVLPNIFNEVRHKPLVGEERGNPHVQIYRIALRSMSPKNKQVSQQKAGGIAGTLTATGRTHVWEAVKMYEGWGAEVGTRPVIGGWQHPDVDLLGAFRFSAEAPQDWGVGVKVSGAVTGAVQGGLNAALYKDPNGGFLSAGKGTVTVSGEGYLWVQHPCSDCPEYRDDQGRVIPVMKQKLEMRGDLSSTEKTELAITVNGTSEKVGVGGTYGASTTVTDKAIASVKKLPDDSALTAASDGGSLELVFRQYSLCAARITREAGNLEGDVDFTTSLGWEGTVTACVHVVGGP